MSEDIAAARRSAIEEAMGALDEELEPVDKPAAQATPGPIEGESPDEKPASETADAKPAVEGADAQMKPVAQSAKAPQSWKPAQRAKWDALDPEVKQEVIRRERDVDRAMTDSAQARQVASAFQQVVQPYMARINALGVHPMAAAQELFKADYVLTTATPAKRAEFMAKLISDYGVDIQELDRALSGGAPSAEQTQQTQLERMLEERMAPLQNFLSQQQQQAQYAQQQEFSALDRSIETMASDAKFPFFDEVREDMADVIEIQAKRGVAISLEQAYTRAIAMNPDVSQRLTQQLQQANSRAAASEGNLKAQRALAASKSVGGAPNGVAFQGANANDRRSTIEAAFSAAEGR